MMEEKFDTEFKRKVKGINPEIPDIVRMRICDTLSALPDKKGWRKSSYLSAVAALFLVCFVGIKYIYPMQLDKQSAPESAQNSALIAADTLQGQNKQAKTMVTAEGNANKAAENDKGNSADTMQKATASPQTAGSSNASEGTAYGITSSTTDMQYSLTNIDGKTAADKGIQLILKTAIYDGKEIRIEFDKSSIDGAASANSTKQENDTASSSKADNVLKYAQVNVAENYDVRIVVNNIPLKCSINVVETPLGENKYSGTMIIVPDSGLPEKLDIILSVDKIGDISGQWLLKTEASKQ